MTVGEATVTIRVQFRPRWLEALVVWLGCLGLGVVVGTVAGIIASVLR